MLGIILLTGVFVSLYISFYPLEYKATTKISFLPFAYDIQDINDVQVETIISPSIFLEEEKIIKSDSVLDKLLKNTELEKRAEYNTSLKDKKLLNTFFQQFIIEDMEETSPQSLDQKIQNKLRGRIFISTIPYSEIDISVISENPELAANLSNTLAELYIKEPSRGGKKEILEKAEIPHSASFEKFYNLVILTGILGIIAGIFSACLIIPRASRG